MKLQYPLTKEGGSAYSVKELFKILSYEQDGHYLLGAHDFWHGGVHFTDKMPSGSDAEITAFKNGLKNSPVKAIADGTIVAYRINEVYKELNLPSTPETGAESSGQAQPAPQGDAKNDPNKFKYATSFCLIRHEYKSPDAPVKMLPEDPSKKTLRVTAANGLTRWSDKETTAKLDGRFNKDALFEVVSEEKNNAGLYMAQGYPLNADGTREQADGKDILSWMNTGSSSQYQNAEVSKEPPKTDWSDPETITVQAKDETGYSYNPVISPATLTERKKVSIPAGTTLTMKTGAATSTAGGLVYYQVTADTPLSATYPTTDAENAPLQQTVHAKGSVIWYPITNQAGATRTGKDADNKDIPAAKADPKVNELTFYSLYMHLLPWKAYDCNQDEEEKEENTKTYLRRSGNMGLRSSAGGATIKTSTNALFEVIDEQDNPKDVGTLRYTHVYIVNEDGTRKEQQDYWINSGSAADTSTYGANVTESAPQNPAASQQQIPAHLKYDTTVKCKALAEINVYYIDQQNKPTLGKLDDLETGGEFTYHDPNDLIPLKNLVPDTKDVKDTLIKITLTQGQGKKQQLAGTTKTLYLLKKEITPQNIKEEVKPKDFDNVIPCSIHVDAGETLGYLGLYESPLGVKPEAGKDSKRQLHFEIFTNDEARINDFLDNAAKVTSGRKYLKINKNAQLVIGKKHNAPNSKPSGLPLAYFLNATTATLKRNWIRPLSEVSTEEDTANKVTWYKIPIAGLSDKTPEADREYGWIKKGENNEELSQYDLRKLDFTVIEERDEKTNGDAFVNPSKMKINGEEEINNFFWDIYNQIDLLGDENREGRADRKITPDEIQLAYKHEELSEVLQKIVGYHPTEWQGQLDTIEAVSNRITADIKSSGTQEEQKTLQELLAQTSDPQQHLKIIAEFALDDLATIHFLQEEQKRLENLKFWDEVPELKDKPKVWHFHPMAFIEYVGTSSIPPWLEVAWAEYEKYKGVKEHEEPLSTAIREYFSITNQSGATHKDPWCAAFLNWCVVKSGYKSTSSYTALSFAWGPNDTTAWYKGWPEGEVYKPEENGGKGKAFLGAILVLSYSHNAIVIGKTKDGKLAILGGNQRGPESGNNGWYLNISTANPSAVRYYMKPKNYIVSPELEILEESVVEGGELDHASTR